jgi:hypothetical protein
MQYLYKVSPIQQIDTKYHQISRHAQMIITPKDDKYNCNKTRRSSYSRTTKQKFDFVEISAQGLNALKQHEQAAPAPQISTSSTSYISNLIANYEK